MKFSIYLYSSDVLNAFKGDRFNQPNGYDEVGCADEGKHAADSIYTATL